MRENKEVAISALVLILFAAFFFMSIVALYWERRAGRTSAAVECYRTATLRDRCLCLTRVSAWDNHFDEHAEEACKEVP